MIKAIKGLTASLLVISACGCVTQVQITPAHGPTGPKMFWTETAYGGLGGLEGTRENALSESSKSVEKLCDGKKPKAVRTEEFDPKAPGKITWLRVLYECEF